MRRYADAISSLTLLPVLLANTVPKDLPGKRFELLMLCFTRVIARNRRNQSSIGESFHPMNAG
jgi:hypothetical protein